MTFFFDENLSPKVAKGFQAFGEDVMHLIDRFAPGTKDPEWIPIVAKNGWHLVTQDKHIHRKPREREAYMKSGLGVVVIAQGSLTHCGLIQLLVRRWPDIKQEVSRVKPPFVLRVTSRGDLTFIDGGSA